LNLNPWFLAMSEASDTETTAPDSEKSGAPVEPESVPAEAADGESSEEFEGEVDVDVDLDEESEDEKDDQEDVPEEIRYEAAVGASTEGIATNNALRALSRAARSFLLYEPRNQAIRNFLAEYRENMGATLAAHGVMELDIRPFEMTRAGEIVYIERDRERSLAFRLFRDGVRRITIQPEVAWEELLRLLEILSIRYTGIRQSEDDIVTLLWKAGFKSIGIAAVEGFVPEEEHPESVSSELLPESQRRKKRTRSAVNIEAPSDFDMPLPVFEGKKTPRWVEVPEERLQEIVFEVGSQHLPVIAVKLVSRLLDVVADLTDPTTIDDVLPIIGEVRDFLLSEGQLAHLTELVRVVESHRELDPERIEAELDRCADTRALRRILKSVGKGSETVPPELLELLQMIPSDHLDHLMDLLVEERGAAPRRLTRMLIEIFVRETWDPGAVFERMHREESGVVVDILRATSRALPDRVFNEAVMLAGHQALDVQMEVLWVMGRADDDKVVETTLLQMLDSEYAEVRIRVLDFLADFGSKKVFDPVAAMVKSRATRGLTDRESQAAGTVMAVVDPDKARPILMEWVRPPGMFKRWVEMPGAQSLQRTALYGLSDIPGKEIDKVIRWLSERCAEDVYKVCMRTLVHRRKVKVNDGG
jgi:hypothetical protein